MKGTKMNVRALYAQKKAERLKAEQAKKPKLVAGTAVDNSAPVSLNLEASRQINQEREARLLEEERRQLDEAHQRTVEFCKRRNILPPCHPKAAQRLAREAKLRELEEIHRQSAIDYHMEMKLLHQSAIDEFSNWAWETPRCH